MLRLTTGVALPVSILWVAAVHSFILEISMTKIPSYCLTTSSMFLRPVGVIYSEAMLIPRSIYWFITLKRISGYCWIIFTPIISLFLHFICFATNGFKLNCKPLMRIGTFLASPSILNGSPVIDILSSCQAKF